MKILLTVMTALILIGALNWGLVGLFNLDLVALLFGEMTTLTKLVYILVGLSALVKTIMMLCGKTCNCLICDK